MRAGAKKQSTASLDSDTNSADSLMELERLIEQANVVSFDFFDTLFVRPLMDPEDAFELIARRHGLRTSATVGKRHKRVHSGICLPQAERKSHCRTYTPASKAMRIWRPE